MTAPHPRAWSAFGRAFFAGGSYAQAIEALQQAIQQGDANDAQALLPLGQAQLFTGQYAEALATLEWYAAVALLAEAEKPALDQLLQRLQTLLHAPKRVLLIGIDTYLPPDIPPLAGAV